MWGWGLTWSSSPPWPQVPRLQSCLYSCSAGPAQAAVAPRPADPCVGVCARACVCTCAVYSIFPPHPRSQESPVVPTHSLQPPEEKEGDPPTWPERQATQPPSGGHRGSGGHSLSRCDSWGGPEKAWAQLCVSLLLAPSAAPPTRGNPEDAEGRIWGCRRPGAHLSSQSHPSPQQLGRPSCLDGPRGCHLWPGATLLPLPCQASPGKGRRPGRTRSHTRRPRHHTAAPRRAGWATTQ